MAWEFEVVVADSKLSEGPVWDGESLLFCECPTNRILRFDPVSGNCSVVRENANWPSGMAIDAAGAVYACEGGTVYAGKGGTEGQRIVRYDDDGGLSVLCADINGRRLNSPNDLTVDRLGRIWFTDPRYGPQRSTMELDHESVLRLDPQAEGSWSLRRMTFDTTSPNGLQLSPDNKILYVAESKYGEGEKRELRAYPILDDDTLGAYAVLHNFYPHRAIDGMTVDSKGDIIATAGSLASGPGPMIYVFAPNGRILETHPVPLTPTNCAFGGADLQSLYVTTIEGPLLRAKTERRGL